MNIKHIFTKEQLELAAKHSYSFAEMIRQLKKKQGGSLQKRLIKLVKENDIDILHFTGQLWSKGKTVLQDNRVCKIPIEKVFCENSIASTSYVRSLIKKNNLLEYKCSKCKIVEWQNMPLVLQLDHINGNRKDTRLENLRWMCPNCHSQTETFCSKNRKTIRYTDEEITAASKNAKNINQIGIKLGCNERVHPRIKEVLLKYNLAT